MSQAIVVRDLTRRFGAFTAVDAVSFEVEQGEIFGYLGANGAGKSTTIRMLIGLLAPTGGRATVAGHDVASAPSRVKESIGYMSQKFSLYLDLPVEENLLFFGAAYGLEGRALRTRAGELLERVGLDAQHDVTTGDLPGGQRQRLALACALLHRPGIVFLDEPTAGVDPVARRAFWELIRELAAGGTTVFVTTHYLDEAEYCRRIGLMVDGKLAALDTPAGLKETWVPDRVLVARGRGLAAAGPRLAGAAGVRAVAPFGAGLHLRVDPARLDGAAVAAALRAAGAEAVEVEEAAPTLEDVFLAVVDRGAGGGAVTGSPLLRSLRRIGAMAGKETIHVRRDPLTLALALVMPVVMLFLFGYGVSSDLDHIPLAVVDQDQSEASRALALAFDGSREFAVVGRTGPEGVEGLFRGGAAVAALVVPRGYQQDLLLGRKAQVQLMLDGADPVVGNQILSKADAIARVESQRLAGATFARLQPPLQVKVWTRYNPEGRSALYMVPGLSAFLLAITAVMLTALAIAGEWERGSMEQLFASPVGRLEIVLGKLLPYLALGLLELLLVVAFGALVFDVPIRGSLPLIMLFGLVFLAGMLGQGLFISVVAKNQLVATQAGALSAMLPAIILSGMIFPIENMPLALQAVSRLIPSRYLVHSLRGILLKGNGLDVLWPDLLAMALFAVAILGLATARFKRRLA